MKIKVFFTIFVSFILAMTINAAGGIAAEKINKQTAIESFSKVIAPEKLGALSKEELFQLVAKSELSADFAEANRIYSKKAAMYYWLNFAVQAVLLVALAFVSSYFVIKTVRRHEKL